MTESAKGIVVGLERLASRKTRWQWPECKQSTLEVGLWWTDLMNRKPHLKALYKTQRQRSREANDARRRKGRRCG